VAWTGTEALFLGGVVGGLCPPNAGCTAPAEMARDGAAYNPTTGSWRVTAPAPIDLPDHGQAPALGELVYQLVGSTLLVYDAADDTWHREPGPDGPADGLWSLQQGKDHLLAVRAQQRERFYPDQRYDPATRVWTALPRDPLVPSFDRRLTWTPLGLVLTGQPEGDQPGADLATALARAAVLDPKTDAWRLLPTTDQLNAEFSWTGRRLVAPALGTANGGEVNGWGRDVPYGGILELPAGTWSPLPNAPAQGTGGWPIFAIDGPRFATEGWFYDDASGRWTKVPRPADAPPQPGAAVWAGDLLLVFGGYTPDATYSPAGLSNQAYSLRL
jgi:hypothetical protein